MKKGWQTKNLGNLCRIRTGKKDVNEGNPDGEFPFFTCAAEHTFSDNYSFDTEALLIAGNGDVGKVSYYKGKFEAYQRTYVLSDFKEVSPRFLYLILDGKLRDTVSKQKLGNTMPYIKVGMLTDFQLPVPSLAERQRIVGLLDEAFEGLATAKANAEKNLQNARALFESHLQSVFTQRGPGWVEHTLGDLIEIQNGYAFKSTDYTDAGYFVIRISNVQDGEITLANPRFIKLADKKLERFILNDGDILISLTGNIGRVGIIQEDQLPAVLNQRVARITVKDQSADLNFLFRFLLSRTFRESLQEAGHGAAQQNVSTKEIESVRLSLPNKKEQRRIVEEFDNFAEETQRLARLYERKHAALEALKKSLLHQAFTGEL